MTSIRWENRVTLEHRRMVESGLFDRIPHQDYQKDDVIVTRYSEDIFQVYDCIGEDVLIGYDKEGGNSIRVHRDKNDIRPINGYAQIMYQMRQPNTKIQIDRHGHAIIEYQAKDLIETKPPFPPDTYN